MVHKTTNPERVLAALMSVKGAGIGLTPQLFVEHIGVSVPTFHQSKRTLWRELAASGVGLTIVGIPVLEIASTYEPDMLGDASNFEWAYFLVEDTDDALAQWHAEHSAKDVAGLMDSAIARQSALIEGVNKRSTHYKDGKAVLDSMVYARSIMDRFETKVGSGVAGTPVNTVIGGGVAKSALPKALQAAI